MQSKKLLPIAIGVLVVLILFLLWGKRAGWIGKDFAVKVSVSKPDTGMINEYITANGKIQPQTEVKISPDVSGEIVELFVEEGDQVEKGDPLCVIKPDMYISALNRAEAALNTSRAHLAQAEAQQIERELAFDRARQLFESHAIPVSEYEAAEAAFKVAEAEVRAARFSIKSAEATVAEAREQLTKTRIFAPISGTVSALKVEQGERVVGTNMYAGTEMMIVAELEKMEVHTEVNENDIVKVALGDTALVEVDAYLNRKFRGVVTEIAHSATTSGSAADQVTNFDVKIFLLPESYADLIDTAQHQLYPFRPGMSATADILTETRQNVLKVPIAAVTTRALGGDNVSQQEELSSVPVPVEEREEVVFVHKGGRARQVNVKTGIQDNVHIEILEGLSGQDEVIVAPYNAISKNLKDSMSVEVVTEEELFH